MRPDASESEMFEYLDELRESGATNMYGAGPYLQRAFGLTVDEARPVLQKWMDTFSVRHARPTPEGAK